MNNITAINQDLTKRKGFLSSVTSFPQLGITIIFLLIYILLTIVATESFFTYKNIINVLRQVSMTMIVAMGMTFILITGGIDLSVGSVACLAGTLTAGMIVKNGASTAVAVIIGLLVGVVSGLICGYIIAKVKIPAFIATLAMMSIARGTSLIYTGGRPIAQLPDDFTRIGAGYILGIPTPVIIMIIVVVLTWITLVKTKFGRRVYAIGGNEETARLSGIKTDNIKILVYTICGTSAALTGILYTARLASSQPTLGEGMEMDAIASVVLGGTSLFGGRGYVFGTIIGALLLAFLSNGLNLIGISSFWQQIIRGVIIVIAVSLYERKKR